MAGHVIDICLLPPSASRPANVGARDRPVTSQPPPHLSLSFFPSFPSRVLANSWTRSPPVVHTRANPRDRLKYTKHGWQVMRKLVHRLMQAWCRLCVVAFRAILQPTRPAYLGLPRRVQTRHSLDRDGVMKHREYVLHRSSALGVVFYVFLCNLTRDHRVVWQVPIGRGRHAAPRRTCEPPSAGGPVSGPGDGIMGFMMLSRVSCFYESTEARHDKDSIAYLLTTARSNGPGCGVTWFQYAAKKKQDCDNSNTLSH